MTFLKLYKVAVDGACKDTGKFNNATICRGYTNQGHCDESDCSCGCDALAKMPSLDPSWLDTEGNRADAVCCFLGGGTSDGTTCGGCDYVEIYNAGTVEVDPTNMLLCRNPGSDQSVCAPLKEGNLVTPGKTQSFCMGTFPAGYDNAVLDVVLRFRNEGLQHRNVGVYGGFQDQISFWHC